MPESTADSVETRRIEDHDFVINLLVNALETECEPNDVSKIARLGKREEGTQRPVLVEFKSRTTKNMVMKSMSKLKSAETKYKQLSITHDMTQKERTQCKLLVQEAKDNQNQQ